MQRTWTASAVLFWQLVNLGVLGYSCAFLFYPEDVNQLFVTPPSTDIIRFMGVLYLLSVGGFNQMIVSVMGGSTLIKRTSFATSLIFYILGGTAGIVVLTLFDGIFIEEQRLAFLILFGLFLGGVTLGLLVTCGAFCTCKVGTKSAELEAVITTVEKPKRVVPKSRADLVNSCR